MVWRLFSISSCEISDSICALNSFEARLNSFRALPICRPISGNFFGPNRIRAKRKRKIISGKPRFMIPMILPERTGGNRSARWNRRDSRRIQKGGPELQVLNLRNWKLETAPGYFRVAKGVPGWAGLRAILRSDALAGV